LLERLSARFKDREPAGPPETLRTFGVSDRPIAETGVFSDADRWRIEGRAQCLCSRWPIPRWKAPYSPMAPS
jgi:hypothetical protein